MVTTARVSLEEFLARPEIEECRLELIDGEVCEKVSPRWSHSRIVMFLGQVLAPYGFAGAEPRAIIPPTRDRGPSAPLPDLAFYLADEPGDDEWMTRPPDLVAEVLSIGQSRREMRAKVDLYRDFGVRSVWVVDLERRTVEVYEDGARREFGGAARIASGVVPALELTVDELLTRRKQ